MSRIDTDDPGGCACIPLLVEALIQPLAKT